MAKKKKKSGVAAAYRSSLGGGNYGAAIAAKAQENFANALYQAGLPKFPPKKKRSKKVGKRLNRNKMSPRDKKLFAAAMKDARAAKKPGKKRRSAPSKKRASAPKSVTVASVIKNAKRAELQRWLCEGARRTGCGSTGKVVSGAGRFTRVR